jgi:uncharacterized protein involved in outer membrane biogenesis
MRILGIAVLALVVIVAGAAIILSNGLDRYRPEIQSQLQQKLNRPVTLGHLGLRLLPLEIKIDSLSIGEGSGFPQDRPFAAASTVFVSASLFSLLRGSPEVNDLVLDKPQIELVRNAAGVWNFSSLGKSGGTSGGQSQFSLNSLDIKDGQVGYTDLAKNEPRLVYDHIDLHLADFAPNKQFGVNLAVHFPGTGQQTLEFKGKVGPLATATENALPPIAGHLSLAQISLAAVNRFASGTLPADTDSMASGEADLSTLADVLSCKGGLKLENTTLNGAKLDYPISATYNLEDDFKQKKMFVRAGTLQLGPTTFTASGSVDTAPTPAILNVELKTDNSSITELAKLTGALGLGFNPAYQVAGKVSADVTAKGPATAPELSGSVTARGLQASGGEIKQAVSIPEIALTLSPASIASNTFTASSGATSLAIAFTILQYTSKNMAIDATVKTDGAKVSELLNIANTYGIEAARGVSGEGQLSLNVHVKGPTANPAALAFAGTASIVNSTFSTPALRKPVSIASANATFSENTVSLSNLAATLGGTTVRGALSAKNFTAPQLTFSLSADSIDTAELESLPVPSTPTAARAKSKNGAPPSPSLLNSTTGSGSLSAGVIKANDIVLKNVSTKVQLDRGVIQLSPLSAEIFGGKAAGSASADLRPVAAQCAVKVKFAGVDANSLLSAVSSVKDTVYGSLAADTNVRFALVGSNDLARTLNGAISFNLTNGVIKNLNIMNEVEKVGKFLKSAGQDSASGGGTAVKKFSGTLNIVNGVANTDNLTGVLSAGSISANGTLNLVSQDVNMHLTAVLGSSTSQAVGGSGIGGFMNTALSNSKGELVVPVLVTGNLSHPTVTPDAAAMAKMKLGNLLPSTAGILGQGNKGIGGALGGILGGLQNSGDAKAKPQQPQANPLGSILDQFKKKKPQ